ncbi:MAG: hypothetical protein ABJB86_18685 [Bacteroidota bacterium]
MKILILIFLLMASFYYSFCQTKRDSLYVFVGEKIEITQSKPNKTNFLGDDILTAKYKVIQNVFGNYKKDTIKFELSFHCGAGLFLKFKNVLLFVSNYNGRLYLEKYQYYDVYKTIDDKWASPGDPSKFDDNHTGSFKPHHIEFIDTVSYDIRQLDNGCLMKKPFPEPYFKLEGNKAIALMGAYIDELFIIKKEGVLKKRGFFE